MSDKTIGVITAAYNTPPELIHQHFYSLHKQGKIVDNIYHIVVDDCSTDENTRAALLVNADRYKTSTILIAKKTNDGPGAARNRAIDFIVSKKLNLDYICLLDADDYLENDSLSIRKAVLDEHQEIIGVYGNKYTATYGFQLDQIDNQIRFSEITKVLENVSEYDKPKLFNECYIPSCSTMFRAKPFLDNIKHFREDVRLCEDWLIWMKLALLGRFRKINLPIYTQTIHGSNLTKNPEVLRNHLKDLITVKEDLRQWIEDNRHIITL